MSKVRSIIFVVNNYRPMDRQLIADWAAENARYMIAAYEVGEKEGTPHIQGYMQFKNSRGLTATRKKLWKLIDKEFHIDKAVADKSYNITYCKKNDIERWPNGPNTDVLEVGDATCQGERTDLDDLCAQIDAGASYEEIRPTLDGRTRLQYGRRIKEEIADAQPDRKWETEVLYIWGATGCGKTRWCWENYPNADFIEITASGFVQGYTNAETVIFDDFQWNRKALTRQQLLRMLDRYPMRVNVKGGEMKWNPKRIIFTNNFPPEQTFHDPRNGYDPAIARRISRVERMGGAEVPPGNNSLFQAAGGLTSSVADILG